MAIEDTQSLTIEVYDVVLTFSTNSAKLIKEIRKDFGSFETRAGLETDGRMRIIETDGKFPLRIPKYAIRDASVLTSSIFTLSNLRFLEEKEKRILRVDFEKNEILGYFKPHCEFSMFCPPRFLLKWMLIKALEKKDIAYIHGSGVERDGSSLFFVGPTGFGKTHALVTFLLEDYRLITDDTIFFGDERVLPFHLRSNIHRDMVEKFPVLKRGLSDKSTFVPGPGWLIDLGDIFSVQEKKVQPSKLFYTYVWNAAETKIEVIPKKEMLSRLFHVYQIELDKSIWFNHNKEEAMRKIFPNYSALVQKADCYKVYAGSNPSGFLKTIQAT